ELAQLAQRYHDRGVLALAAAATDGDAKGLSDLAAAARISATVLARTGADDPRRVPQLLLSVLARWARFAHTGDAGGLPVLDRLRDQFGELADADPDGAQRTVTMTIGELMAQAGRAGT